jgi:tetratricopeptide (TPR) repeat protein
MAAAWATFCNRQRARENTPAVASENSSGLKNINPLNGTLFPPEIAPPTFRWEDRDPKSDCWHVRVRFQGEPEALQFDVQERKWTPDAAVWATIKKKSIEHATTVMIEGAGRATPEKIRSASQIAIRTSRDEVGAPLFYREVNLPFEQAVKDPRLIRWRFGAIDSPEPPPVILENLPVCGNCHSFSQDGRTLAMDVDYANSKGSYVITPVVEEMLLSTSDIITWDDYRREDKEQTFGLLSQISPDGRYVASTVKDRSVFVPRPNLAFSQLFFPIKGILAVYDREAKTFAALPGADDRKFVQSNPTWSPDGKYILFARARAHQLKNDRGTVLLTPEEVEEFIKGKQFKFDLYRIPFNGGKGGTPEPLKGASQNGMSNFFPRCSPDGKWIVFCKAKNYMLLQPDSELYIIPAEGGAARRLECNTARMNSWHSWSPNSKWLVFSSKGNSDYTQLFLTHIDEQGRSSPAVLLDRFTAADRAANIPEFVNAAPSSIKRIREQFLDDYSFLRAGNEFFKVGDMENAIAQFGKSLELNPNSVEAQNSLGAALLFQSKPDQGIAHLLDALRLDPNNPRVHFNLGIGYQEQGRIDPAINHFTEALRRMPDDLDLHYKIWYLHYRLGKALAARQRMPEASDHLAQAVRLNPKDPNCRYALGLALLEQKPEEAALHLAEAVRLEPANARYHFTLAQAFLAQSKAGESVDHVHEAARLDPKNAQYQYVLAQVHAGAGELEEALARYAKAVALDPKIDTSPELHDYLGIAYAQAGRFREAVQSAEKALALARAAGKEALAKQIAGRLELYKQNKPYIVASP